ncbi:Iron-binding protein IscA [Enhygromyxa salina]|uniref:Iron-binding protein IscA n=1 Tax=Enhygromyxa salina TaxID=215803 RepID=A0A2S9XDP0_9BACT|nr:iron-sulfur cluster assembly accessory protein [Enhygromyxa salina]PRP90984.1 Iron-binding protein IscA [Enhygromyxa salina]
MTQSSPNAAELGRAPSSAKDPDRAKLTVTPAAAEVMRGQLTKRGTPDAAIRFGIRGGGCTGYSYVFEFSDKPPRKNDHVVEAEHGVRVYVDPKSMIYLEGTTIHFEKGMRGHGFQFDNPNVKNDCGCGESVSF